MSAFILFYIQNKNTNLYCMRMHIKIEFKRTMYESLSDNYKGYVACFYFIICRTFVSMYSYIWMHNLQRTMCNEQCLMYNVQCTYSITYNKLYAVHYAGTT